MITCGIFKKYIMYLVPVPSFHSLWAGSIENQANCEILAAVKANNSTVIFFFFCIPSAIAASNPATLLLSIALNFKLI